MWLETSIMPYSGASNRPASSASTMSANRPSRRKIVGDPSSTLALTTCPSSTTVLLPGSVLAGTGVEASASPQARPRFGSRTATATDGTTILRDSGALSQVKIGVNYRFGGPVVARY
mgnify:CR=1 FL=1